MAIHGCSAVEDNQRNAFKELHGCQEVTACNIGGLKINGWIWQYHRTLKIYKMNNSRYWETRPKDK